MVIDTHDMSPDDAARRWPAECNFDDEYDSAVPEGGFIAILAVFLFACVAIGSLFAAFY